MKAQREKDELDRLKKEEMEAKLANDEAIELGDKAEDRAMERKERKKKLWRQMNQSNDMSPILKRTLTDYKEMKERSLASKS